MLRSETAANPERMKQALEGLRKYQEAVRVPGPEPMPVVAETRGAGLRDYGGSGNPVVFVPSLINPPNILDLSPERSLLRWLATQGHRVLLLDWGWPGDDRRAMSVALHVEEILLPLIEAMDEPPALVGYCLGGTMAVAAARAGKVRRLVTIAAPWHFDGFPQEARTMLARLWAGSEATAQSLGVLPMEALQSAFWSLDPSRTVAKFEAFSTLEPEQAASFVALEDWANDGPPIGEAAAREIFRNFFGADVPGSGGWRVAGMTIDPADLPCPLLNIVSTSDRIVPHATAIRSGERIDLAQGHVGMVVGSRARIALWEPLAAWLSRSAANC